VHDSLPNEDPSGAELPGDYATSFNKKPANVSYYNMDQTETSPKL